MNSLEVLALLRIAIELADRLAAIAKQDPQVWESVKDEYNKAKEAFENASSQ